MQASKTVAVALHLKISLTIELEHIYAKTTVYALVFHVHGNKISLMIEQLVCNVARKGML